MNGKRWPDQHTWTAGRSLTHWVIPAGNELTFDFPDEVGGWLANYILVNKIPSDDDQMELLWNGNDYRSTQQPKEVHRNLLKCRGYRLKDWFDCSAVSWSVSGANNGLAHFCRLTAPCLFVVAAWNSLSLQSRIHFNALPTEVCNPGEWWLAFQE